MRLVSAAGVPRVDPAGARHARSTGPARRRGDSARSVLCAGGHPWLLAALLLLIGCSRAPTHPPLRLGFLPNLTHAQALVGDAEGVFASAVAPAPLEVREFNAGPAAMEALLGGSLDVVYIGSGPALTAWARAPGSLHVIAGSAAGGSVLIARHARSAAELRGKKVGSPQLGNTQDVALRMWLQQQGLHIADPDRGVKPGEVEVVPLSNPDILALFRRGDLEAAWVPEPWGARLIAEAGGHLLVNEADLWPRHTFPTTLLVVSDRALKTRRPEVLALLRAHVALTRRARANPQAFFEAANQAYGAITGHPLPEGELDMARGRITLELDPLEPELTVAAQHAQGLGFIPDVSLKGFVDPSLLEQVEHGEPLPGQAVGGSPR